MAYASASGRRSRTSATSGRKPGDSRAPSSQAHPPTVVQDVLAPAGTLDDLAILGHPEPASGQEAVPGKVHAEPEADHSLSPRTTRIAASFIILVLAMLPTPRPRTRPQGAPRGLPRAVTRGCASRHRWSGQGRSRCSQTSAPSRPVAPARSHRTAERCSLGCSPPWRWSR